MNELFLTVINMSLIASYVILFVILVRLLLRKAPKVLSYSLWGVVAFRLIIPFSFESIISLLPRNMNTSPIPPDIIYQHSPKIYSGIEAVDTAVSDFLPQPAVDASVNPLQVYVKIGSYIWVIGTVALLVYSLVSVLRLKRQLKRAQLIETNIFVAKNLKTPFVLGLIKPKIYLPDGLNTLEKSYIIRHEQTHIHRKDHIIKVLAFLILSAHWFNPLVWIAFRLMSMDMELSCDQRVIKEMDKDVIKPYANSLLSLSTDGYIMNGGPLAFGEGDVKGRIKNVLNYKKPRFWIIVISVLVVVTLFVGLLSNPKSSTTLISDSNDVANDIDFNFMDVNNDDQNTSYAWDYINKDIVVPTVPELSLDQPVGVDMVELNYASDDIIIFHDFFGLFVYDLNTGQIIRSLDLKPINCHYTQGDYYCVVTVSMDGNTVQLHPISSENMYIYTVSDNTLEETIYEPDESIDDSFGSQFVSIEKVVDSTSLGLYSHHAVRFSTDDYGYIYTEDGTIGRLTYVRGNTAYKLFDNMSGTYMNQKYDFMFEIPSNWQGKYKVIENDRRISFVYTEDIFEDGSYQELFNISVITKKEYEKLLKDELMLGILLVEKDNQAYVLYTPLDLAIMDPEKQEEYRQLLLSHDEIRLRFSLKNHSIDQSVVEERNPNEFISDNVTTNDDDNILIIPGFSEDEIAAASKVVEKYFQAVQEKDNEAARKTLMSSYVENHPSDVYNEGETLTLLSIDYSEDDDNERKNFVKYNEGKTLGSDIEDVIVLRVGFDVELSEGVASPFDEGVTNWIVILVRDGNEAPWLIADMGYR